jgi:predicted nucleic acid-binding protein
VLGYLLDTNHVAALCGGSPVLVQKVASLPANTQFRACTITLGEFEAGHLMTQSTDQKKRDDAADFLNRVFLPNALPVSISTRLYYAQIISRIWQQQGPAKGSVRTEMHLVTLGVDINDVWVVAVAWEHGLVLVTKDKMEYIKNAVPEVRMECWL